MEPTNQQERQELIDVSSTLEPSFQIVVDGISDDGLIDGHDYRYVFQVQSIILKNLKIDDQINMRFPQLLTIFDVAKWLNFTKEQQDALFRILLYLIYLHEDGPEIRVKMQMFTRDQVLNRIARPNNGTEWYVPISAREATRLFAETNESIIVYEVPGFVPTVKKMLKARLATIDEQAAKNPQAE